MSTRSLFDPFTHYIRILVALAALAHPAVGFEGPHELADEAIRNNPGIEALQARTQALSTIAGTVGTWTDPVVGIEYSNVPIDSFRLDRSPMSGLEFKLEQKLPGWGSNSASRQVAESRAEASRYATAEAQVQLRRSVEVLFWRLTLSDLLRKVTHAHVERTQELLDSVRGQYEVGNVGQNAVLRLGVLRDRLLDDLSDFQRIDREISAALVGALSRPPRSEFETPARAVPLAIEGTAARWLDLAQQHRPLLEQIREEVLVEAKEAKLSRVKTRPEVNLWAKYRIRTIDTPVDAGTDFMSFGLAVPIPWGSRKQGLGQASAHLEAERGARARLAAAVDQIESELQIVEAAWSRAYEKASTYHETLIPAARATLTTTLSDFSVGNADFASLYQSQVDLLMLEKAYITATIETHVQGAAARSVTGSPNLGEPQ